MFNLCLKRLTPASILVRNGLARYYASSIEPLRNDNTDEQSEKDLKLYDRLSNITRRKRVKKPQREPFVKNFLVGVFDTTILTFPELTLEEYRNCKKDVEQLENVLKQNHMIDVGVNNKAFRQNLSDYKAIGLQCSQFLEGREASPMETLRFLDALSTHPLRDSIIHNEVLGVQTLNMFASEQIQKKYLYPAIKGDKLIGFAFNEENLVNLSNMKTIAELTEDKKRWILNGKKNYVVNGAGADYLIVFATTNTVVFDRHKDTSISAFIVDKDSTGISWKSIESNLDITEIHFDNVEIPVENLIGTKDCGDVIIMSALSEFRLSTGAPCNAISNNIIQRLHQHFVDNCTLEHDYLATDAVRSKLGEVLLEYYAAESVAYLTAGLKDWYEDQDVDIESAIVKVVTSEAARKISNISLDLIGPPAIVNSHWARKAHDNILTYLVLQESNETQRLFIALNCLEYAGKSTVDTVKKLRNPFNYSSFMFKKMFSGHRQYKDNPKLDLRLNEYLHPSCHAPSLQAEYCIKRLEFATEMLFTKYGLEIVNKHADLRGLADVIIECYTMVAVLARASRSYCIGLQCADLEMMLAILYCNLAKVRVQLRIDALINSDYKINDRQMLVLGKRMVEHKKLFVESPISRFF